MGPLRISLPHKKMVICKMLYLMSFQTAKKTGQLEMELSRLFGMEERGMAREVVSLLDSLPGGN